MRRPQLLYPDADGDGFGDIAATAVIAAVQPSGHVQNNTDCNDTDALVHPGATDIPGNGIDQDCDGMDAQPSTTWYQDADGDVQMRRFQSRPRTHRPAMSATPATPRIRSIPELQIHLAMALTKTANGADG